MSKTLSIQEKLNIRAKRRRISSAIIPFLGLVFITVFLIIMTDGLLIKGSNLTLLVNQCFTFSIVGVGAAFVYAHGGMDFSIGASSGLAQYVMAFILTQLGLPVYIAILASLLLGMVISTIVGGASILLKIPVFITSLCMRAVCTAILAMQLSKSGGGVFRIDFYRYDVFNNWLLKLGVLIAVFAVGYFLFEKAAFGKTLRSIGGNILTAYQGGLKVNKNIVAAYSFFGLCVGLAAFFQLTRSGMAGTQSGGGLEFDIMIALMLGGFPLSGGSACRLRAVIVGALTIAILTNGLVLWGIDVSLVNGIKGLLFIIIIAISYDRSSLKQFNMVKA